MVGLCFVYTYILAYFVMYLSLFIKQKNKVHLLVDKVHFYVGKHLLHRFALAKVILHKPANFLKCKNIKVPFTIQLKMTALFTMLESSALSVGQEHCVILRMCASESEAAGTTQFFLSLNDPVETTAARMRKESTF